MQVDINGREIEGMPLAWSRERVFLLSRDGSLWDFAPNKANRFRKSSGSFSSYSAAEMRAELVREFGGRLEVTGTGHYLVAHPKGQSAWAQRFEDLYRSCIYYFRVRGMQIREPEFPLVAVVWPRHEDFLRNAAMQGGGVRPEVLGFYSPTSNRVTMYDQSGGGRRRGWNQNDATIIHEATHQMAFNTGVHNRFSPTPKWLAEGLGTMFEAPGVWDWRDYPRLADRLNRPRLESFRAWQSKGRKEGTFTQLLASDRMFDTNPQAAYAEAWAWVLFLTETYPQKFGQYVGRVAAHADFQDYPRAQRVGEFTSIFGNDLRMLERHFENFMAGLDR